MTRVESKFIPVAVAILTVSDSRTEIDDTSGHYLAEAIKESNHIIADKQLINNNIYKIRAIVSAWIADENINVIVVNGGTGFSNYNQTPEALIALFDREIEGFGGLFRMLSYEDIGTSAIQSRAIAGIASHTLIFAIPGSTSACRTAWQGIIKEQLDARHQPCNFVAHLKVKSS